MNTDILQDDESFLMVNVRGRSSGLPMNIWIGPRGGAKHAPRIKVQMDHREQFDTTALAVVSIEDNPPQVKEGRLSAADIESVRRYLAINREAILDHWYEKTDGIELGQRLRSLP